MQCAAIIAAAGLSSRMHEFKPMMRLGERTIIENVIQNLQDAGVEKIIVVTGYKSDVLQKHVEKLGVRCIKNKRFAETKMFESVCLGLQTLQEPYDRVFITPGDVPLVQPTTMRQMLAIEAKIVRPTFNNKAGHPILISSQLIPRILEHNGNNGLSGAIKSMDVPIVDVPVNDAGILLDADTREDLKILLRKKMKDNSGGRLWPNLQIHIAKNDDILTPEIAQFLEMIKHTGSIQSACVCMHMSYARGSELLDNIEKELGYPLVERTRRGMNGEGTNLTNKGDRLLKAYQLCLEKIQCATEKIFSEVFTEDLHI